MLSLLLDASTSLLKQFGIKVVSTVIEAVMQR